MLQRLRKRRVASERVCVFHVEPRPVLVQVIKHIHGSGGGQDQRARRCAARAHANAADTVARPHTGPGANTVYICVLFAHV